MAQVVKNSSASEGDTGDVVLMPGLGRSLEKEMVTHSGTLAWRIPWTGEPGGLQSMGLQSVGHYCTEHTHKLSYKGESNKNIHLNWIT